MKKIVMSIIGLVFFAFVSLADDRPVTYDQLPAPAKAFIEANFNGQKVTFASKDDDLILPDYNVLMADGTQIEFSNSGSLKKVSSKNGISAELVPVTIREYVAAHYPEAGYLEYEVGRRTYEVKLTNRMELKFNSNFNVIEVDY